MPIYEYLCEGCGTVSEVIQKLDEPPPRVCPDCGSSHLAKIVSRSAFQLKGGGWYADLYASTNKEAKKPEKADKPEKTDKPDKPDAKAATAGGADKPAPAAVKPAVPAKTTPSKAEG
ncbi:MAG TPA: FmdB family zinc ribbon protein [Anaeromyxobacteraceae bacterium]|nr:FmdB family zinc ribbon protein [Anaeromyxobacteraceae bacterium]